MKRLLVVWMFVVGWLFFPGTVSAAPLTPDTFAAPAPPIDPRTRIASNLGLLLALSQDEARALPGGDLGEAVARVRSAGAVAVSARFIRTLSAAERAELEALGVAFNTLDGELLHAGCIYGLTLPLDAVDALAAHPLVEWLEAAWHPAVHAPLDVSTPATLAPTVWHFTVPSGGYSVPLTGRGVTVANFDTGIDVTHPAFLDGYNNMGPNDCNWDYNSSGSFDPGTDRFSASSGVLRFWNAAGDPANTGGFDVTQDWVYQDDNGNSAYDVSELIFMARDTDGDGVLESGECLRSRGNLTSGIPTSKIAAVLDATGTTRVRGSDLDLATVDANGHGTSVAGIIAAGNAYWCDPSGMSCTYTYPNTRMYTGVAPGADLLVADRIANSDTTYIPWAATYGADVMLYEYGAWVGQYMDGSSNHEQMMDTYAAQGIVQVVPTGNLHCNASYGCNPRHLQYSLSGSATFNHQFNVPNTPAMTTIYASMIWLNPSNNLTV
ncbi:MAG: S8 family serine peptidase, partial [Anaerolineae bacterium]|nr:S8 family serine peptidase [Anaerolineae bacterium]